MRKNLFRLDPHFNRFPTIEFLQLATAARSASLLVLDRITVQQRIGRFQNGIVGVEFTRHKPAAHIFDVRGAPGGRGQGGQSVGVHYAGATVWSLYAELCETGPCTHGVVRIDATTNEIVASAELREGWPLGGMSVGPTTAWTWTSPPIWSAPASSSVPPEARRP